MLRTRGAHGFKPMVQPEPMAQQTVSLTVRDIAHVAWGSLVLSERAPFFILSLGGMRRSCVAIPFAEELLAQANVSRTI